MALLPLAASRWCQLESVKADTAGDFSFSGEWRLDGCTTLQLDHGKCAEADCPYRLKLGDEEVIELADALHGNTVLTALSISSNKVSDEGAKALAEALRDNEALVELNLQANQIEDGGAIALAEAFQHNPTLSLLNLEHNLLHDAGGRALLGTLQANTSALETLHLSRNPISADLMFLIEQANEHHDLPSLEDSRLPLLDHGEEL